MTFTNHTGWAHLVAAGEDQRYLPNAWADPCGGQIVVLRTRPRGQRKPTKPRKKRGRRG